MNRWLISVTVLFFCAANCFAADTIKLKNGELVHGDIVNQEGDFIRLRGDRLIKKEDINWIRRDPHHHGTFSGRKVHVDEPTPKPEHE